MSWNTDAQEKADTGNRIVEVLIKNIKRAKELAETKERKGLAQIFHRVTEITARLIEIFSKRPNTKQG
jgi:hypothetical protein